MVDFAADWCAPCKELDRALARPDITTTIVASFVPLRVDVTDDSDAGHAKQERYGATTLPNLVFVTSTGKVIARVDRLVNPDELAAVVAGAAQTND